HFFRCEWKTDLGQQSLYRMGIGRWDGSVSLLDTINRTLASQGSTNWAKAYNQAASTKMMEPGSSPSAFNPTGGLSGQGDPLAWDKYKAWQGSVAGQNYQNLYDQGINNGWITAPHDSLLD